MLQQNSVNVNAIAIGSIHFFAVVGKERRRVPPLETQCHENWTKRGKCLNTNFRVPNLWRHYVLSGGTQHRALP